LFFLLQTHTIENDNHRSVDQRYQTPNDYGDGGKHAQVAKSGETRKRNEMFRDIKALTATTGELSH
jgi:hypothetical protein